MSSKKYEDEDKVFDDITLSNEAKIEELEKHIKKMKEEIKNIKEIEKKREKIEKLENEKKKIISKNLNKHKKHKKRH